MSASSSSENSRTSISRELWLAAAAASLFSVAALAWCRHYGLLLLYGDAVAHLHIARRVFDTRTPAITQLGSVWLPLPHVLLAPFVAVTSLWRSGMAGAFISMPAYVLSVVALYRLARFWLGKTWSVWTAAIFALNPGLLYMQTTAMTEPLFLCLVLWAIVWMVQALEALRSPTPERAAWPTFGFGVALAAAVLTRYDGWVFAALAGLSLLAIGNRRWLRAPAAVRTAALAASVLIFAAPLWWLWYNHRYFGDWLDFLRGPYSARAIEERTRPKNGARYPGYHNLWWAWLYYGRVSTLGAGAWRMGQALMALAIAGSAAILAFPRRARAWCALLLWFPLPFYAYSVAYGSVPIFFPLWPPFSYYNTRYGMEMLPVLSLFPAFALAWLWQRMHRSRMLVAGAFAFVGVNAAVTLAATPLVLAEAIANSRTRIPFETNIARALAQIPSGATLLVYSSAYAGALQQWGRPLRETINESDWYQWQPAMHDPAHAAPWVLAVDGDPVAQAVAAHPEALVPVATVTQLGQPRAVLYRSEISR